MGRQRCHHLVAGGGDIEKSLAALSGVFLNDVGFARREHVTVEAGKKFSIEFIHVCRNSLNGAAIVGCRSGQVE